MHHDELRVNAARDALEIAQRQYDKAKSDLAQIVNSCKHEWNETKYVPVYEKGYTFPGDPPGTMGVDWQGPCHVPSKTIPEWSRTCKLCGHTQTTRNTKPEKVSGPISGTYGTAEVPSFNDYIRI